LIVTIRKHEAFEKNEQVNRQETILAALIANPSITLKKSNRIKRVGSDKTGHWEVSSEDK
jgi:hypothetical protein